LFRKIDNPNPYQHAIAGVTWLKTSLDDLVPNLNKEGKAEKYQGDSL